MSYALSSISGSGVATTGTSISLKNGGSPGGLIIYNASLVALLVDDTQGNQHFLPSMTGDRFPVYTGTSSFKLYSIYTVTSGSGGNPDTVSFIVQTERDYTHDRSTYPVPLGATLGLATIGAIQNDGNPAGTQIIEATPSGGSQDVLVYNDGRALFNNYIEFGSASVSTSPTAVGVLHVSAANTYSRLTSPLAGGSHLGVFISGWTGVAATNIANFGNANPASCPFWVNESGTLSQVGNQASAGSFGVPVIVAQAIRSHVTATTVQTILTYAVTTSGIYRISGYFALNNSVGGKNVQIYFTATDPDTSAASGNVDLITFLGNPIAGGTAPVIADGSTSLANSSYPITPSTIAAKAGTNIVCSYQDPAGVPNDYVTFIIERLA